MSDALTPVTLTIHVCNRKGLHARATAKFVKTVAAYQADVQVRRCIPLPGDELGEYQGPVGGTSLMGLMMLAADKGTELEITATGEQAKEVLVALEALILNRFDEGE